MAVTASVFGLSRIDEVTPAGVLPGVLILMGMGLGMTILSLVLAMQNVVSRRHLGVATSFGQFTRSIGGAVGVAVLGAVIAATLSKSGATSDDMVLGIQRAFFGATLVSAAALLVALRMPAGLPADLVHPDNQMSDREASTVTSPAGLELEPE